MKLSRYSIRTGDRFGRQGRAQLAAFVKAESRGVAITPVWNKSNREHQIIHTAPASVRAEADAAVRELPPPCCCPFWPPPQKHFPDQQLDTGFHP